MERGGETPNKKQRQTGELAVEELQGKARKEEREREKKRDRNRTMVRRLPEW
jgi:hypothetical protein